MYVSLNYKDEFFCDVYELILEENYIFLKRNLFSVTFVNFDCDFINNSIGNLVLFNKYITIIFYFNLNMQYY